MALKQLSSGWLAHCVWVADSDLMLDGCCGCWMYKLLQTMSGLEAINGTAVWDLTGRGTVIGRPSCTLQLVSKVITWGMSAKDGVEVGRHPPDPRDVYACCMGLEVIRRYHSCKCLKLLFVVGCNALHS